MARSLLLGYLLVLQGCPFSTCVCRFLFVWPHSHLGEFCQCTLRVLLGSTASARAPANLEEPRMCLERLVHSLVCLCDLPDKPAVPRCERPSLWGILVLVNGTTTLSAECTVACMCFTSLQIPADFTRHPPSFGFTWGNAKGGGFHGSTASLGRHTLFV